jgi:hypothetical protein
MGVDSPLLTADLGSNRINPVSAEEWEARHQRQKGQKDDS